MSGLLFGVGAFAVVVGAAMIGFGIPINEFSFGNTLIVAGVTAATGGLIVVGLGVVVAQLQRIGDALATRTPIRPSRPLDVLEPVANSRTAPSPGRAPFPAKPTVATGNREPYPLDPRNDPSIADEADSAHSYAPTLRNPDEPTVTVEDEVSLSPQHPMAAPTPAGLGTNAPPVPPHGLNGSGMSERGREPTLDTDDWRPAASPAAPAQTRQPHTAYFDAMWPAEPKPGKSSPGNEAKPEPKPEVPPRDTTATSAKQAVTPEVPTPRLGNEPRAVGILKSGVVDGMGYTLYVDGSIEAELPQGTLRFASINELRSHLEKNT